MFLSSASPGGQARLTENGFRLSQPLLRSNHGRQLALSQTPQPAHSSSARKRENTNVLTAARLDSSASRD